MQGNSVVRPTRSWTTSAEANISSRLEQQKIPAGFWGADSLELKQEPPQVLMGLQEHHVSVSFFLQTIVWYNAVFVTVTFIALNCQKFKGHCRTDKV